MPKIETKEAFNSFVAEFIETQLMYRKPIAFGICRVDRGQLNPGKILQATFPVVNFDESRGSFAVFCDAAQKIDANVDFTQNELNVLINKEFIEGALQSFTPFIAETGGDKHKNIQVLQEISNFFGQIDEDEYELAKEKDLFYFTAIFEDVPVQSVQAAYLKLYLLSLAKVPIRSLNLSEVFKTLHNCAWSGNKPYELEWLRKSEIRLKINGKYPPIDFVDKFPRFLQHIIPADNTRILETSKVRFGAQLAAGTTVMPGASYVNFNAGTTGPVMVEGRISSSAIVGAGSDVGGGASILGVLSGTNGNPVSIGENTLLGANSVTGIPLGNACIVDAGIAVLEGTKCKIYASEWEKLIEVNPGLEFFECGIDREKYAILKGSELSGLNGLHFRQDSNNGAMIVKRSTREVKLNVELH